MADRTLDSCVRWEGFTHALARREVTIARVYPLLVIWSQHAWGVKLPLWCREEDYNNEIRGQS